MRWADAECVDLNDFARNATPVLWRAVSIVVVLLRPGELVVVGDSGGSVLEPGDARPTFVPYDKVRVTTTGAVVAAVGKGTVRSAGGAEDLLERAQVLADGAHGSVRVVAAGEIADYMDSIAPAVREQVGCGEFTVDPDGRPVLTQILVARASEAGIAAHVAQLPAHGLCYSTPVNLPGAVLGVGAYTIEAAQVVERAQQLSDTQAAVEEVVAYIDVLGRSRPLEVSRTVRIVVVRADQAPVVTQRTLSVQADVPRH